MPLAPPLPAPPYGSPGFSGGDAPAATEDAASIFTGGFIHFLILAAVAAVVCFILIKLLQRFAARRFSGNMKIFYRILYIVIIAVAVFAVLSTIQPLQRYGTALLAGSGVMAAVLGLAAQQTLGNLFSGMSISATKPFLVDELVEVLGTDPPISGTVKEIGLRHTIITDFTGRNIVIPNSVLDKEIVRTSHSLDREPICSYLTVRVGYECELTHAIAIIRAECDAHEATLDRRTPQQKLDAEPKTQVFITDLATSGVMLRASVWTMGASQGFAAMSELRHSIKERLGKEGIHIPAFTVPQ